MDAMLDHRRGLQPKRRYLFDRIGSVTERCIIMLRINQKTRKDSTLI